MKTHLFLPVLFSLFIISLNAQEFVEITGNGWGQGITESKMAMADIDNDGLIDILVGDDKGHLLHFEFLSPGSDEIQMITKQFNDIDVGYNAAPAFIDLDEDGLLDLLIGHAWGTIYHYEQESQSSTAFDFITDEFNDIDLYDDVTLAFCDLDENGKLDMAVGYDNGNGISGLNHYEQSNPGSISFEFVSSNFGNINNILQNPVPTLYDLDNDNQVDLLLGNYFGDIHHYEQDSPNSDNFSLITNDFLPGNDVHNISPQIFNLNGDDILELFVGENTGKLMLYQQEAQNSNQFELVTENMNKFDMGMNSSPVIEDVNNDGLYDILVGNNAGTLWHFIQSDENIIIPETQNFAGIQLNGSTSPCIADIDNDNLYDILITNMGSQIYRFEQVSSTGCEFSPVGTLSNIYEDLALFCPAITDFENDGLLDLIYAYGVEAGGYYLSYLKHYRQMSLSSADFEYIGSFYSTFSDLAYSAKFGDINNNGLIDQLDTGNGYETLAHREQSVAGSLIFDYVETIQGISGNNLYPSLYDIDSDGDLDIVTGGFDGGLCLFENQLIQTSLENNDDKNPIKVSGRNGCIIVENPIDEIKEIEVYNMMGQLILTKTSNQRTTTLSIGGNESIYLVRISSGLSVKTFKVFLAR